MTRTTVPSRFSARLAAAGATAVVAVSVLAGCGSSGGSSPSSPASSGGSSSTSQTSASTGSGDSGGGSASGFCGLAKESIAENANITKSVSGGSPSALKAVVQRAEKQLPEFVAAAPSELKSSVDVVAAAAQKIFAAFDKAGYDIKKLSPGQLESFANAKVQSAAQQIATYVKTKCGVK